MKKRLYNKRSIPIAKFFPNVITFLGLCIGLTAIKYSFAHKWELAVTFILIAAIIDGMDGRLARILDSTSHFGAELDSLADLISFGVAPAFLLFFWQLNEIKVLGWAFTMAFVLCMAIRLARFNATLVEKQNEENILIFKKFFFTGVPAPVGAILVLLPVILSFHQDQEEFFSYFNIINIININNKNYLILGYIIFIATLTVSKLPTFSLKHLKIPAQLDSIVIFIFAVIVIFSITKPWITIPVLLFCYLISIPVSCIYYSYLYNKNSKIDETDDIEN